MGRGRKGLFREGRWFILNIGSCCVINLWELMEIGNGGFIVELRLFLFYCVLLCIILLLLYIVGLLCSVEYV